MFSEISAKKEGCGTLRPHPYSVWEAEEHSTDINYCKSINIDIDTQHHNCYAPHTQRRAGHSSMKSNSDLFMSSVYTRHDLQTD